VRALGVQVGRSGGEVPFDARPANLGIATWMDDALAGAADFADTMCVRCERVRHSAHSSMSTKQCTCRGGRFCQQHVRA